MNRFPPNAKFPPAESDLHLQFPDVVANSTVLPNGLTVLVREDRSAPVASVQAWVNTGSIHEGNHLGAGHVAPARAHALQGHRHALAQPDRARRAGRGRLRQRVHLVRSHGVLDRCAVDRRERGARDPGRRDHEFHAAAGGIRQGAGGHPARVRHAGGRSRSREQPAVVRHRLSDASVPASDHRAPRALQPAHARRGHGVLQGALHAEQYFLRRGGRCARRRGAGEARRAVCAARGAPAAAGARPGGAAADRPARGRARFRHGTQPHGRRLARAGRDPSRRPRARGAGHRVGRRPERPALPPRARDRLRARRLGLVVRAGASGPLRARPHHRSGQAREGARGFLRGHRGGSAERTRGGGNRQGQEDHPRQPTARALDHARPGERSRRELDADGQSQFHARLPQRHRARHERGHHSRVAPVPARSEPHDHVGQSDRHQDRADRRAGRRPAAR